MHQKILKEILTYRNKEKGALLNRFFKTGKGQYGEGDIFLGITVPLSRSIAKKYIDIDLKDVHGLLKNKYHEVRLIALLILVQKFKSAKKESEKEKIYNFYLNNTKYINNWDLVDLSSSYIVGGYLVDKDRKVLLKLAKSNNLWERRISIISTFSFIFNNESEWTFKITKILMEDKHDLIQKACGWMLREVGKRVSEKELRNFLDKHTKEMPRTMLRYSIERFDPKIRQYYLKK